MMVMNNSSSKQEEEQQEMVYASFEKNFKVKDASFFTGTWGEQGKWPRVLVISDSDFPLTHEKYKEISGSMKEGGGGKSVSCNFVVIDGIHGGFTKVPLFKEGGSFKNSDGAKPMSKVVDSERMPGKGFSDIHCWPWTMIRENPQAKGLLRDGPEDSNLAWKLQPGMVIRHRIWEDSMRGYPTKDKKPTSKELNISGTEGMDFIPAFTPMIVDIAIKAWCPRVKGEEFLDTVTGQKKSRDEKDLSPVMRQYGMSIADMKIANGTAYSLLSKLRDGCILSTHMHSEAMQKEHVEKNWAIANSLQTSQAPMFVQDLAPDAFFLCDEENGIVKISQWSSGVEDNAIDVKIEDVKRFTNTERVEDGLALMEFACQAGCLEMLCMHNKYRRKRSDENPIYSEIYGVPLINVPKLIGCVKLEMNSENFVPLKTHGEDFFEFDADYRVTNFSEDGSKSSDEIYRPKILVSKKPITITASTTSNATTLPCPDLALTNIISASATPGGVYEIKFVNTITGGVACKTYFNLSKPCMMNKSSCGNVIGGGSRLVRKRWASGEVVGDPENHVVVQVSSSPDSSSNCSVKKDEDEGNDDEEEEEEAAEEEEESTSSPPPPVVSHHGRAGKASKKRRSS